MQIYTTSTLYILFNFIKLCRLWLSLCYGQLQNWLIKITFVLYIVHNSTDMGFHISTCTNKTCNTNSVYSLPWFGWFYSISNKKLNRISQACFIDSYHLSVIHSSLISSIHVKTLAMCLAYFIDSMNNIRRHHLPAALYKNSIWIDFITRAWDYTNPYQNNGVII